ncbi:hypothetical protein AAE478_006875 [Parahypoxylon ruwenzoriense]
MSIRSDHRDSQPGLELAPSNAPEVYYPLDQPYLIPVENPTVIVPYKSEEGKYSNVVYYAEQGNTDQTGPGSRRKLFILIGIVVAIAIIVGAVVGGVLGSRTSNNGSQASNSTPSESSTSPLPGSTAIPEVNTTAVRRNTKISVTGRRLAGNGFASRLFWQGGDNKLRTSRYTSTSGSWSTPLVFKDIDAKPGTPIAATIYLVYPQFEVFYLDPSSTFRGLNFGEDETVPKPDSINEIQPAFTVDSTSKMAAYWPYVLYQNANATFHRIVYGPGVGWFNDTVQGWFNPDVMPLGDNGTGIAVVPVVRDFQAPYAAGVAYRDPDGRLSIFSFGGGDTGISWHAGSPSVSIPAKTAIAAFATTRRLTNTTNTHILYQDGAQKIQAVWQVDGNDWQGPEEVGDADEGTDIACLTEQTGDQPSLKQLSDQTDMNRCYYQSGGLIVEKRLTTSGWIDGNTIPME